MKSAIVLAPHPDDVEFGCGATVKYLTEQGITVHYVVFSPCYKSVPKHLDKDVLYNELDHSIKELGVHNSVKFQYPVREFPKFRQEILEELVNLKNQINPDLVFLPNSNDIHQDHQVINQEGIRAFKHCSILGYELPWNNLVFKSNFHYKLSESHIDAKWQAISKYQSQGFRNYSSLDFIKGLARVRGTQVGCQFAESFELIRWIN